MKVVQILFSFIFLMILSSCTDEIEPVVMVEELSPFGSWDRTDPQFVAIGPTEIIERGELHTILQLRDDGIFSFKRVTIGIYLDQNPEDTSAFREDLGTFVIEDDSIHVDLHTRVIWDSFFGDNQKPDSTENLYGGLFRDATYQILEDSLFLNYHNLERHGPEFYEVRLQKRAP